MKSILLDLHCPRCAYHTHMKSDTFIHADFEPQLKEAILEGTYFSGSCKQCHERISFLHECLYIDQKHHYMLLLKAPNSTIDTEVRKQPHIRILRLVTNAEQFQEKIRIFDDNFHDYPMEQLKYKLSKKLQISPFTIFYHDYDPISKTLWFQADEELKGVSVDYYERCDKNRYEKNTFTVVDASLFHE